MQEVQLESLLLEVNDTLDEEPHTFQYDQVVRPKLCKTSQIYKFANFINL